MAMQAADAGRRVRLVSASAAAVARPSASLMTMAAAVGAVAVGAAVLEAALIPGIVAGGAAILAPGLLPGLRRRVRPWFSVPPRLRTEPAPPEPAPPEPAAEAPPATPPRFAVKQAVAKTITFRVIVTTLDFSWNYAVLGEVATAAGLSAFALAAGPVFYLVHEAAWHSLGASARRETGRWGPSIDLTALLHRRQGGQEQPDGGERVTINRALAKTITFRTFATTMDFATNWVVVGDVATAAVLSAFGFVVGPFVYLGHEMAWDYYGAPRRRVPDPTVLLRLLPAPA
jgi:uncharacterized membrane protein